MFAAEYSLNTKMLSPTRDVASGPAAIEMFFAELRSGGLADHKLEVIDAEGVDKVVYGTTSCSARGNDKDAKHTIIGGIATNVFERQAGNSLKLRLHTFN